MSGNDAETTGARRPRWRAGLAWGKAVVSIALLWLLFTAYDIRVSIDRLAAIEPWAVACAALIVPVAVLTVTVRWHIVLASLGERIAFTTALAIVIIGLFFNQVLPTSVGGDAMRAWRLSRRGIGMGRSIGSVILDRITGVTALALLVLVTLPVAVGLIADGLILAAFAVFIAAVPAGLAILLCLDRVTLLVRRVLPPRLVEALSALARDSRAVLLNPGRVVAVLALAVFNHILIVLLVAILAWGLGIRAEPVAFLVLIPPVLLATMLPLSFAGWGVREGAMVVMLGAVGVAPGQALALSVAFGLLQLVAGLPGGIIWLATGNRGTPPPRDFA